jgi:precorrin-6Y C5,15-methyltransferase (decarboxylating)
MSSGPKPHRERGVLTVVGIGADGLAGLSPTAAQTIAEADVLFGSDRQLALVPDSGATRVSWPSPLLPTLPGLLQAHSGQSRCVLASGDPMFFGIGTTLVRLLGADNVRVLPHPSSVSLVCARLGWAAEAVEVVNLVGRPLMSVTRALQPGRQLLLLSADSKTPARVATLAAAAGYGPSRMTVLEQLGSAQERCTEGIAQTWQAHGMDALNIIAIECEATSSNVVLSTSPGLPDSAYDHDGQLTKREVRAITLSRLIPIPGHLLWDVGAGSGSVGIEWMRTHPACRAIAIERDAERLARISRNRDALGVPGLQLVHGSAPDALVGLDRPDAIFIGGGLTGTGVLEACWEALRPMGRLVANAVTVESETVLASVFARLGGDLTRIDISRAATVGAFTGWKPAMPVTQWTASKP